MASSLDGTPAAGVLVAGIGNIFQGDDGFGVEVARVLATRALPRGVTVADFGIRGVHLACELMDSRYHTVILVDAMTRGGEPGTLYVLEPDPAGAAEAPLPDAHGLTPDAVLAWVHRAGGTPPRVLIVGCEPATVDDSMGLSEPVARVVAAAADLALEVAERSMASPVASTGPAAPGAAAPATSSGRPVATVTRPGG
jgi:hydrogenase maturation protease